MSNPYETAKRKKHSVLGPTLRFKGELTADEDLLIQGRIEGSIKHTSSLTVGEEGQVTANIVAEYIAVEGKVNGDLSGSQSVVIRETADIDGNIYSPVVTLLEGATFNGTVDMTGKKAADTADLATSFSAKSDVESSDRKPVNAESSDSSSSSGQGGSPNAAKKKSQRSDKKSASAA